MLRCFHSQEIILDHQIMFVKANQFGQPMRNVHWIFKRNYNLKKLSFQTDGNPQLKNLVEEKLKKNEQKGVINKFISKRTGEYKEYFSRSADPSVVKRPKHVSYDHIGQKRAVHLSKVLRSFLAERIGSGEIGDILSTKNFQLTNIIVPVDLNRIEILWWSPEQEANVIEDLLRTAGEELRTAIRHAQLLPNLPPVIFKRDNLPTQRDQINYLIDTADKGSTDQSLIDPTPTAERTDLYDSDRTTILRKLSPDEQEEPIDTNELSVEQLQRRMKAFALTKRMKRVQESRNAIYGIMAIEKERDTHEHFSLTESIDAVEFDAKEKKNN